MSDGLHDLVNHLDKLLCALALCFAYIVLSVCPVSRNVNLDISGCAGVDCLFVHFNDFFTLLHELLGFFLHIADCLLFRKNLGEGEESGLKNGVCALAETDLCGNINSVNGIELNVVLCNISLCFSIELFGKLLFVPLAVDEENTAGLNVVDHFVTLFNI